jgi:hypothetical protein
VNNVPRGHISPLGARGEVKNGPQVSRDVCPFLFITRSFYTLDLYVPKYALMQYGLALYLLNSTTFSGH